MAEKLLIPYVRQSRKKEVTISLDEQRAAITTWAEREGVKLALEIVEQGVSGSKSWRERELGKAVEACEQGQAAGIVVAWQDRLSRENGLATAEVWQALEQAGVRFVAVGDGIDTATGDHELLFSIKAAIARDQWKRYRTNWINARRNAIERGVHPSTYVAVGYRRNQVEPRVTSAARASLTREQRWADPVVGQLVPSAQAEHVRALFTLRAAGGSWSECARLMESRGVPNRKGEPFWLLSAVQAIIRNPAYRGEAYLRSQGKQAGDLVNPDAHEPLVDAILWRKAQPTQGKPRRSSEGALLAGILRCASCGRRLSPSGPYYRCRPRMVTGPECPAPASAPRVELEALVTRGFFDWLAYRPLAPAPPDLAPLEQAVALAKADEAEWKEAAVAGTVAPEVVGPAYDAAKARREEAEKRLFEARQTAGLDDERLTLAERWGTMSVPERRRALQAFEVAAYVERGRQPLDERVTIELRGSPVSDGWEPDVDYVLPSDQELAEKIAAEFAAAGLSTSVKEVAERIAAWTAKYADAKIVIEPLKLSDEDRATAEAIFGPLERAFRKRQREAKRKPKTAA
ncbi:MAG TPA: recombinase family protein [Gaiellaceae bacterium]|nr:recombinase family protein [Gaiellaceae bacterium]